MMKFDFHCHSHFSDGQLSPVELVDYALEREIELLALTDHDTVDGIAVAQKYINKLTLSSGKFNFQLAAGVEISALTDFGEVHVVGLNIDSENQDLLLALKTQQGKRWQRAEKIDQQLGKLGVTGVLQECEKQVVQVITRSHIAKAIVSLGHAKDMQQAFKKYIGKKGRIKVSKGWMSLEQAISLIHEAGGISILAHPTRYPLSNKKLSLLIENFKLAGGQAMEMAYPSLNKDKRDWLKIHLDKNQLLASSGSDFHYSGLKWSDLGRFPVLDGQIPHVIHQMFPENSLIG